MAEVNEAKWYVVHVLSTYENMVLNNLYKMIENSNLGDYIFEVVVPMEDNIVEKNGKRKLVQSKKFPGYVFIKMIYTNYIWYMVTNTRGVTGFVGPAGRPFPLTDDEIKRMGLEKIEASDLDVVVGDNVRIISGPLEGYGGVVKTLDIANNNVCVALSMFGRETPVELELDQISLAD